jgi:RNA recognition motif-containing protein
MSRVDSTSTEEVNHLRTPIHMLIPRIVRDRENCTVFVSDLPDGTTPEELTTLFKDVRSLSALSSYLLTSENLSVV